MDFIKNQIQKEKDKRKSASSEESLRMKPARLEITIESPPLVSYGTMARSTGALMSGQLRIHVTDLPVKLEKYELELIARIKYAKPVSKDCPDCQANINQLQKWDIITEPKTFEKGSQSAPFSFLFEGHLPATTHNVLGSIEYILNAVAVTANGEKMTTSHTLHLKRALVPSENDRMTLRVFPPTNLRVELMYPPVIYPTGEFNAHLSIGGIVSKESSYFRRFRLQRIIWRLEEHSTMTAKPCPKHAHKIGGESKGTEHSDTKTIGSHEAKTGWKSDFSYEGGGSTTGDFTCHIDPKVKVVRDMSNPAGMAVQHRLVLELIVGEEIANLKQPSLWNATGTSRVLRMAYTIIVTERGGEGISWDEELPPMYEDVPASPPGYEYKTMEDYDPVVFGSLSPLAPEYELPEYELPQYELPQQGESSRQGGSSDAAQSS